MRGGRQGGQALLMLAALSCSGRTAGELGCYTAYRPPAQNPQELCLGNSHRTLRICAHSQAQADGFATSHYSNPGVLNMTLSSCSSALADLCSQVQGAPVSASANVCCRSPVSHNKRVLETCSADSDCHAYSSAAVYSDLCVTADPPQTCMPRIPTQICCGWCEEQMKALCGQASNPGLIITACNSLNCSLPGTCFSSSIPPPVEVPVDAPPPPPQGPVTITPPPISLPPAPVGVVRLLLQGLRKEDFNEYMQTHFLKVVSSVARISEVALAVRVTSRRSAKPARQLLQAAGVQVEVQIRAPSEAEARILVHLLENVVLSGVLVQALKNNGIPVTGVIVEQMDTVPLGGAVSNVQLAQPTSFIQCHETCQTCILEGRDGCILCKDGYLFWQPPERQLDTDDENGQCVGNWDEGMMLVWGIVPVVGLLCIGVCIYLIFNGLDLSIDMGKRRHKRREVRWVPVNKDDPAKDLTGLGGGQATPA